MSAFAALGRALRAAMARFCPPRTLCGRGRTAKCDEMSNASPDAEDDGEGEVAHDVVQCLSRPYQTGQLRIMATSPDANAFALTSSLSCLDAANSGGIPLVVALWSGEAR